MPQRATSIRHGCGTIAGCIERGNCIAIDWIKKVAVLLAGYVDRGEAALDEMATSRHP
ncbi:hypothetical protein ACQR1H_26320 [Bradyrhizobium sp. HKCCYLRH2015]|uniref:hypothetical protein n=1 Tax=Bradyrhizobium TaxID=374 RepID=UPI003EB7A05C